MDQALIKIGLPVSCSACGEKGYVKPATDYGGWYKQKLITKTRWYCPAHSEAIRKFVKSLDEKFATPEPEKTLEATTEELYALLD